MSLQNNALLVNKFYWALFFFMLGMSMIIYQFIGFDFAVMPGDMGDSRFTNYLLEHAYQYLTNSVGEYWSAPFFFPEKNAISYADNLFGIVPFYVLCRQWADRETSFQLLYLIVIALNYWGAYYAARKLNVSVYASSVGAFIYAFSLIIVFQINHITLLPRFAAPFAIVSFYLWLQSSRNKYFYISMLLFVYQFYCAVYLGYFLLYALLIVLGIHLIKERKITVILELFKSKKDIVYTSICGCVVLGLLVVLFYPYYLRSMDGAGYPPMIMLKYTTPRLWSYLLVFDNSVVWGWTNPYVLKLFSVEGLLKIGKQLFIGIVPHVLVAVAFFKYRSDARIKFFLIALLVYFIFTLSVFDFNIYMYIVQVIPGAKAIRMVSRYIVIAIFFWSIISALSLDHILDFFGKWKIVLMVVLPVFMVADNIYIPADRSVVKKDFQKRSALIVEKYESQKYKNPTAKVFSVHFNTDSIPEMNKKMNAAILYHIDVMMASQVIGLPCVNGCSAKGPPDYDNYFLNPNEKNLNAWLHSNRVKSTVNKEYNVSDVLIVEY